MPQSWKQGQVRLISKKDKPQTIGDARPITLLNADYGMYSQDANKWCDNKVETRDVHCALKPLSGSLRRTQIVASVSKVAWTRVRRMPSDQTRNHAWRVAHQISLRTQQTDGCKCDKRMTVDDVHFEC